MDFLKSLAGMFTSSVLRLAVAVGTIAAISFFAIRPVLDTTNKAIDSANSFSTGANGERQPADPAFDQADQPPGPAPGQAVVQADP